ncbi:MAG: hypothetical protein IJM19_04180 [Ruminococcus sp.]|nr:hypothetical protein [Ruminococcus sp.]
MRKIFCFALCLCMASAGNSCGVRSNQQIEEEKEATRQDITENVYDFQGYVTVPEDEKYAVMHSEPDEKGKTVTHLRDGEIVDIFEFSGEWFLVKSGSFEGYVKADRIILEQPVTTVVTSAETSTEPVSTEETTTEETIAETETETTAAETEPVTETEIVTTETTAVVTEVVTVTEIVYVEVPVTTTTEATEQTVTEPETYYQQETQPYEYTYSQKWIPGIDTAYVYALPSETGYGYDYYLNITGNYDYVYVTYVTQGIYTTDTIRFETNEIKLTTGTDFSGIYAYVVPYYNGEIEGETVFCSCESPDAQYNHYAQY